MPQTSIVLHWIGRAWLAIFGWKLLVPAQPLVKGVLVGAPHTSNWDLPHMLAVAFALRVRVHWLGKHTLFFPPLGWLLRLLGGIPVDRRAPAGIVKQTARAFDQNEHFILAVPASGTRSYRDHWKSGFYWIAKTSKVPIYCGTLDYEGRQAGIGLIFTPSGDVHADMDRIRTFYAPMKAKYPELQSMVRLKEERKAPDA